MKKTLTIVALGLGMASAANAQGSQTESQWAPEKGNYAVELGFTPFQSGGASFKLNEGMLKLRYFLTSKDAIRLKIGVGINNETTTDGEVYDPIDKTGSYWIRNEEAKTKDKNANFDFLVGYERHLFTKGRFDVYAGLEVGYGLDKYSGTETTHTTTNYFDNQGRPTENTVYHETTDYHDRSVNGSKTSSRYFNSNLFAGVDFYVWKSLYLGAEVGLNFKTGKSPNTYTSWEKSNYITNASGAMQSGTYERANNGTITSGRNYDGTKWTDITPSGNTATSNETKNTSFGLFVEPAVRIGWRF